MMLLQVIRPGMPYAYKAHYLTPGIWKHAPQEKWSIILHYDVIIATVLLEYLNLCMIKHKAATRFEVRKHPTDNASC